MSPSRLETTRRDEKILSELIRVWRDRGESELVKLSALRGLLDPDAKPPISNESIKSALGRLAGQRLVYISHDPETPGHKMRSYKPTQLGLSRQHAKDTAFKPAPNRFEPPVVSYRVDPKNLSESAIARFDEVFEPVRQQALQQAGIAS